VPNKALQQTGAIARPSASLRRPLLNATLGYLRNGSTAGRMPWKAH